MNQTPKDTKNFKLKWHIENGNLPDVQELVSKDLEGSVSTPGLGSLPPPNYYKERHEYTAVIELQHNITDVIGDGALVVDVFIVPDNRSESEVKLFTGEPKLEYNKMKMNWSAAEEFCVSKGGHLASAVSPFHWRKLQSFIADNDLYKKKIWLGGTDEAKEGEWTWTDGSKWNSFVSWDDGEPNNLGGVEDKLETNYGGPGLWNDIYDWIELGYICQYQAG